jgi:hypothetical protein
MFLDLPWNFIKKPSKLLEKNQNIELKKVNIQPEDK